jgi:hypothetical protein
MTEQRPAYTPSGSSRYEDLPPGASSKPCPRCKQPLFWSDVHPPKIEFDKLTGFVSHIEMDRWCICGYAETGFINIDKQPTWTEVVRDDTLTVEQEVKERARLAAQWLSAGLTRSYQTISIDWQQAGLQAVVIIDGVQVGALIDVYDRLRTDDDFYPWLRLTVETEQARAYLAEQGFQPHREGTDWQIVYPKTGWKDTLTDKALCQKAQEVKEYNALHPVLKSNPTIELER